MTKNGDHTEGPGATPPAVSRGEPLPNDANISDNFVRLCWERLENSKTDLERNWTQQMIVSAINVGLTVGLADLISHYLFRDTSYRSIMYVIFPTMNIYFFSRFGGMLTIFRQSRDIAEESIKYYFAQNRIPNNYPQHYVRTNSMFEVCSWNPNGIPAITFTLFVAVVISCGHSASLYILVFEVHPQYLGVALAIIFITALVILYTTFFIGNKDNKVLYYGTFVSITMTFAFLAVWIKKDVIF